MKTPGTFRAIAAVLSVTCATAGAQDRAGDPGSVVGITAVSSKVAAGYVRARLADGSYEPETYALWEGGRLDGTFRDRSVDDVAFRDIVRVLVPNLASQNYLPTRELGKVKLLIVVYWGTTQVPQEFAFTPGAMMGNGPMIFMENIQRDIQDSKNAKILGYDNGGPIETDFGNFTSLAGPDSALAQEMVSEIEQNRYVMVLMAYDYQAIVRENRHVKLWETRLSVGEQQNHFSRALPAMVRYASTFFGQDSRGLIRTRIPEGQVQLGEPRALGTSDTQAK